MTSPCEHGHRLNECPLPATDCNYSWEYAKGDNALHAWEKALRVGLVVDEDGRLARFAR